ncbi:MULTISPECIES: hemolysin family protein [Bosea]|jgi:CBS domain containing-hemolysin-like protein|uniref:Hemolysin family protein n=1 Tax=Bosea rubneri TaxID=3075434 RepID=A0ABU3SA37_9HYPH|nr:MULTISPECIES: hemolysin family protein [unclassified Bosea (in: a-proteobacteria)]MDU0341647.1 hemolysin family protein [Bosea sp. ZW T0_25]HEV7335614.1 hemolysin family protein [Bosea sp. (in: a-proteobacteria)]
MSDDPRSSTASESAGRGLTHWLGQFLDRLGLRHGGSVREEITEALAQGSGEIADISPQERAMLSNVLSLRERRVDDVMIPRADIIAVSLEATLASLLALFRSAGHSRLPVYGETLDDPRGMIHIRDFLDFLAARAKPGRGGEGEAVPDLGAVDLSVTLAQAAILRPVLYVPPSMPAVDLLVRMQATRTHIALVIDEYGGTDGLVSIEDLIEIVVGDIEDEHDHDEAPTIAPAGENRFIADARATLEDLNEATGIDLSSAEVAEEVDTLGGLIVTLAGRVPARGELIKGPEGLEFEVLDADPRRVKRLRIHRRDEVAAGEATAPEAP